LLLDHTLLSSTFRSAKKKKKAFPESFYWADPIVRHLDQQKKKAFPESFYWANPIVRPA
jgi:hypothetical protein